MSDAVDAVERALAEGSPGSVSVEEAPQHARLLHALASERAADRLSFRDFAVLLRAALREGSVRWQHNALWVPKGRLGQPAQGRLAQHGLQVVNSNGERVRVRALPWGPDWLEPKEGVANVERQLFEPNVVAPGRRVDGDPFLLRVGHDHYSSEAQRETFIVGPAVDEAAIAMDAAHGGVVWFARSALAAFQSLGRNRDGPEGDTIPHVVHLKEGGTFSTFAVNIFSGAQSEEDCLLVAERIRTSFGSAAELAVKRLQTEAYLEACLAEWKRWRETMGKVREE